MLELLDRLRSETRAGCRCALSFDGDRLRADATDCDGTGDLAADVACRAAVVEALADREATRVLTRNRGLERAYEGRGAALLCAAGRFVERIRFRDERLARRATRDPLSAAREASGRAGPASDVAARTGLVECAADIGGYEDALRPYVNPTIARSRVAARPPPGAVLADEREHGGATARIYARPGAELRRYHLAPPERALDADAYDLLARAHELLATGGVSGGSRAPGRAVRRVAGDGDPVALLTDVLRKHTRGYGVLSDLFADPAVSDVFATAPVAENRLRVVVDGETMRTNVRLTEAGAASLASRFRRTSGRAFSRAEPTLDATAEAGGRRIRVAGLTDPVSDGIAFAFRSHDADAWTLPALVANGTLPAGAAGLLSVAVERSVAGLVAGTRGAGKTTLLGALLWELPARTRALLVEDTPELPASALRREGRDVQSLRTTTGGGAGVTPAEAVRTALRLGDGALVVGEVRGEEAQVLYEAMRVGASGSAVLGTVHGDGGAAVRERVVSDLGVSPSAFGTTDLVVTLEPYETDAGTARRVSRIEEVVGRGEDVRFAPLYELDGPGLVPAGRIARGNSRLLAELAASDERYADVRTLISERASALERLADEGRTAASDVVRAHADRRGGA